MDLKKCKGIKELLGLILKDRLGFILTQTTQKSGKTYKHQASIKPQHNVLRAACLTDLKCRKTISAFIANQFTQ
jgi:hypothetical protein